MASLRGSVMQMLLLRLFRPGDGAGHIRCIVLVTIQGTVAGVVSRGLLSVTAAWVTVKVFAVMHSSKTLHCLALWGQWPLQS